MEELYAGYPPSRLIDILTFECMVPSVFTRNNIGYLTVPSSVVSGAVREGA